MKTIKALLCLMMTCSSLTMLAQSKGQMAFTSSSSNANKLLRQAWTELSDFKVEEGNKTLQRVLSEDPDCGMAYASLFTTSNEERNENLTRAATMKLSADERMLLEGIMARINQNPTQTYFDPLIRKYPSDDYLHLVMMFNSEPERAMQIGEAIIKKKPKFAPAHNLLGYVYMNQNDLAKAQQHFDTYISLRPDLANPYDSKADFMMRTGKIADAAALYEKAASLGMPGASLRAEAARARLKFPEPLEKEKDNMKAMILGSFEASKKSDADGLVRDYSEHCVQIFGDQRANVGLPNVRKGVVGMFTYGSFAKHDFSIEGVHGTGPIAVAYGKNHRIWKPSAGEAAGEQNGNMIYMFRKTTDGSWKILVDHFYDAESVAFSGEDKTSIEQLIRNWETSLTLGEVATNKTLDRFSAQYSQQAIEIFSNGISNIGLPNLRARWENFAGVTTERNSLGTLGVEGLGRRAVAWGIANQNFSSKDSEELQKYEFPWAMIFTKEKDDRWRILVIHWGAD